MIEAFVMNGAAAPPTVDGLDKMGKLVTTGVGQNISKTGLAGKILACFDFFVSHPFSGSNGVVFIEHHLLPKGNDMLVAGDAVIGCSSGSHSEVELSLRFFIIGPGLAMLPQQAFTGLAKNFSNLFPLRGR